MFVLVYIRLPSHKDICQTFHIITTLRIGGKTTPPGNYPLDNCHPDYSHLGQLHPRQLPHRIIPLAEYFLTLKKLYKTVFVNFSTKIDLPPFSLSIRETFTMLDENVLILACSCSSTHSLFLRVSFSMI